MRGVVTTIRKRRASGSVSIITSDVVVVAVDVVSAVAAPVGALVILTIVGYFS